MSKTLSAELRQAGSAHFTIGSGKLSKVCRGAFGCQQPVHQRLGDLHSWYDTGIIPILPVCSPYKLISNSNSSTSLAEYQDVLRIDSYPPHSCSCMLDMTEHFELSSEVDQYAHEH